MGQNKCTGYLAPVDFEADLSVELSLQGITILEKHGRLFLCEGAAQDVVFAQDTWNDVVKIDYTSIGNAAEILRGRANRWSHYSINNHRRAELILEKVPSVKIKRYNFLDPIPMTPIGVFSLLSESEMLVSNQTNCPLPFGEINFNEDKINPPSRAYLKLWELFTLYKIIPTAGMRAIDVGSCPGGWTWVLQNIGCEVVSVDKAPLDPKIAALPRIDFRQESAFGLRPQHIGKLNWFFSDIICYPDKLLELVTRFRDSGLVDNFACTIKFQAPTDFDTMFKLKAIPGSRIVHLSCNKHEVTWINLKQDNQ
ncbi:MAG: SAM-dependent methyltransferase [Bacteriovorax sp.]|nr:SAM-dependent methyltransferase [Bacteriovorax sp.]